MIIVSYYTKGNGYEQEVAKLRRSLISLELKHHIEAIDSLGTWRENLHYKTIFIKKMLDRFKEGVLWVDADAIIHKKPDLVLNLTKTQYDIGFHLLGRTELLGGTLYFGWTLMAQQILHKWIWEDEKIMRKTPHILDQFILQNVVLRNRELAGHIKILQLPASYVRIYDNIKQKGVEPVIEHFQASRRLKAGIK